MEELKERKQLRTTPESIRIVSLFIMILSVLSLIGAFMIQWNIIPLRELEPIAEDLRKGVVLGIPVFIASILDSTLLFTAALGLQYMKKWSLYLFCIAAILTILGNIYAYSLFIGPHGILILTAIFLGFKNYHKLS